MNELALVGRIHGAGSNADYSPLAFLQGASRLDGTSFIPPQQRKGDDEKQQPESDSF